MKKIFATFLILVFVCSLVGCTHQEVADTSTTDTIQEQTPEEKMANSHFIDVVENPYSISMKLVYDSETHIIYYYQNYKFDRKAASSLCPYYSANGYICRYNTETNQIEEIIH